MNDHSHTKRFERLAKLSRQLDSRFRIPGIRIRIGFDGIAGLIPGVGDAAAALPAAWIMLESYRMGLSRGRLARQGANIAIDTVLGSVPVLGSIFDIGFKANLRNVEILRIHLEGFQGAKRNER